jgi:hypothetical protein
MEVIFPEESPLVEDLFNMTSRCSCVSPLSSTNSLSVLGDWHSLMIELCPLRATKLLYLSSLILIWSISVSTCKVLNGSWGQGLSILVRAPNLLQEVAPGRRAMPHWPTPPAMV